VFIAGYVVVRSSGIASPAPEGLVQMFHRAPLFAAVCLLGIQAVLNMALPDAGHTRGRMPRWSDLGFILAAAGILLSSLTRFEGTMVLAEGQAFGRNGVGYLDGSVRAARFADAPSIEIDMLGVAPVLRTDGMSARDVKAQIGYTDRVSGARKTMTVHRAIPAYVDGMFLQVREFGYSPRYRIWEPGGTMIDEAYVLLKVFPPGAEDSFSLPTSPYTFSVRYDPAGALAGEGAPAAGGGNPGPVYILRITRIMDLVLPSQPLALGAQAFFEQGSIAFVDTAVWAELTVVKDRGLYLLLPGAACLLGAGMGAAYGAVRRIKGRKKGKDASDAS
jgi:hypothetical protein